MLTIEAAEPHPHTVATKGFRSHGKTPCSSSGRETEPILVLSRPRTARAFCDCFFDCVALECFITKPAQVGHDSGDRATRVERSPFLFADKEQLPALLLFVERAARVNRPLAESVIGPTIFSGIGVVPTPS